MIFVYTDATWICENKFKQISIYWRNQTFKIYIFDFRQYTSQASNSNIPAQTHDSMDGNKLFYHTVGAASLDAGNNEEREIN